MTMDSWYRFIFTVTGWFRRRRAQILVKVFPYLGTYNVCDLGGSKHFWRSLSDDVRPRSVDVLNVKQSAIDEGGVTSLAEAGCFHFEVYDGRYIPRPDQHYDLLLSNSVLEHVAPSDRRHLVSEMNRVAARLFVQTPAKLFPVDPHFLMPLVHWAPRSVGRRLAAVSPWRVLSGSSRAEAEAYFDTTDLLSKRQLRQLFPQGRIHVERFLGCPKSYLVIVEHPHNRS